MARTTKNDGFLPAPVRRRVAILAFDGVVLGDLAIPMEVFGRALDRRGRAAYELSVCGAGRRARTSHLTLDVPHGLRALEVADTIVVPGIDSLDRRIAPAVLRAVSAAVRRGARVASICTGAFVLAATGALDGRAATTHWLAASELARRHPAIRVDPRVLYVDEGELHTSAGASAAFDLCLHLVRRDLGAEAAAQTARACVMPLERAGGQAQFIALPPTRLESDLGAVLAWAEHHLAGDLSIAAMARRARMSERTFCRRFAETVGATPAVWVKRARVRRAQRLLETTDWSVDRIATETGFGSATALRDGFRRIATTTPRAHRRAFGRPPRPRR